MKKTRRKHLLRSIRKGGVSFLAVAVIAAVSIAIYHGFQSSANAILQRADRYFKDSNLETLEITCANGITQEDINAIASWNGVQTVEGGYVDSVLLNTGTERILVQARSLLDTINQPVVVEGALPTAADEAAIEEYMAEQQGIGIGDAIILEQDGCLTGDTFTVTAIVNIPVYCCVSLFDVRGTGDAGLGSNEYYVCLTRDAFDADHYSDCYTTAYIDSDLLDGVYYFTDTYAGGEAAYLAQLEPFAQERAQLRYEELQADADADLADAQQEIDDARAEIAANEIKLDDAGAEIADNEAKLDDARQEIADREAELDDARAQLADGEQAYASAQSLYEQNKSQLSQSRAQLDSQLTALGLPTDLTEALSAAQAMGEAGAPLVSAIQEYQAGEQHLRHHGSVRGGGEYHRPAAHQPFEPHERQFQLTTGVEGESESYNASQTPGGSGHSARSRAGVCPVRRGHQLCAGPGRRPDHHTGCGHRPLRAGLGRFLSGTARGAAHHPQPFGSHHGISRVSAPVCPGLPLRRLSQDPAARGCPGADRGADVASPLAGDRRQPESGGVLPRCAGCLFCGAGGGGDNGVPPPGRLHHI